ncbi:MAG: Gx transporter family protein [Bacilli bacterium]|nr:Gx transporter family protein [Bacilli bacterium]MDD7314116.1 Gx transporter family protein [Bacilli bacterium]MDY4051962.1 Gx transporter family protein [Bacilli bacterium]
MKAVKKITYLSICISLALILSYVESLLPTFPLLAGVKLGLPNIVIIFLLYKSGWKDAVIVSILRVFLVALLFGNAYSLAYSIAGAILSLTAMILLKQLTKLSTITVSVIGGVFHNIGQILVACFVTTTVEIAYYLPVLIVTGTVAGVIIGLIGGNLAKKFQNIEL